MTYATAEKATHDFKVGEMVEVYNTTNAYSGSAPLGTRAKVTAIYPQDCCRPHEILLEGFGTYVKAENVERISVLDKDPIHRLKAAVNAARDAGVEVSIVITTKVVETL